MNMSKLLIILILSIVSFSCSSKKELNCEQFKNGNFTFHLKQGDVTFSIHRQDSIQIEKDTKTGLYSKLSVRWIDKCNYEALLLETTFPFSDSVQKIRKTIPFQTEIISTAKDYYVFKSHRGNSAVLTDTMWLEK
jgi:hypothetical protein